MLERWKEVEGFPEFEVSDHGRIRNTFTGRLVAQSDNVGGDPKINIIEHGQHLSRSVKELVAQAFVNCPTVMHMTERGSPSLTNLGVINIDGDKHNCHYTNLAWRPMWFVWKYTRQFNVDPPRDYYLPLINTRTGQTFRNTMEAGIAEGLLWEYVINSASSGRPVFPTGSVFEFA